MTIEYFTLFDSQNSHPSSYNGNSIISGGFLYEPVNQFADMFHQVLNYGDSICNNDRKVIKKYLDLTYEILELNDK